MAICVKSISIIGFKDSLTAAAAAPEEDARSPASDLANPEERSREDFLELISYLMDGCGVEGNRVQGRSRSGLKQSDCRKGESYIFLVVETALGCSVRVAVKEPVL